MDETTAHAIGRAFARVLARLRGKQPAELRVGLGRDMRLTAPAMAAELRDGTDRRGRDRARRRHGRDRDALPPGRLARARRRRDGHRLAQPQGLHRGEAGPRGGAAALRRRRDRRRHGDEIEAGLGDAPGGGSFEEVDIWDEFRAHALSFIDPAKVKPMKVVVDGGNGMGGPMVGPILEQLPLELEEMYFEPDGEFPDHEPNPLLEENRRMIMERVHGQRRRPRHRLGRRRRPLLLHRRPAASSATATSSAPCWRARRWPRTPARRSSTTPAPAAPCRTWSPPRAGAPTSRGSATPSSRRGCARRSAVFGGEVSGHYYFRDFWNADSGTIPALLMLELLSLDGRSARRADGRVPLQVLHLRRDQLRGRRPGGEDGGDRRALLRRRA